MFVNVIAFFFIIMLNVTLCFLHLRNILVRKTFCRNNEFLCSNGEQCIPQGWVCDRAKDCSDGSDENSCGGKGFNKTEAIDSIHDSLPPSFVSRNCFNMKLSELITIYCDEQI